MNTVSGVKVKCDIPTGSHVNVASGFILHSGVTVIGLQFSGNAATGDILSVMGTMLSFPATIKMPCGWLVTIPSLDDCSCDLMCPCGNPKHYIIRWGE